MGKNPQDKEYITITPSYEVLIKTKGAEDAPDTSSTPSYKDNLNVISSYWLLPVHNAFCCLLHEAM